MRIDGHRRVIALGGSGDELIGDRHRLYNIPLETKDVFGVDGAFFGSQRGLLEAVDDVALAHRRSAPPARGRTRIAEGKG
jgi:hypothetical protein